MTSLTPPQIGEHGCIRGKPSPEEDVVKEKNEECATGFGV
jgi:hypothetical protein